ncbi:hypothetical protein [Proteus faecis]|uniref:hypothetical protein n=1 Tax=Proteus faecis TaxID=2050967 RepID=UPI0021BAA215|nr:hypothetical protein [Proteus faecis]MCT8249541.1 hypothetical protein [Proteus faecis]
MNKKWLLYLIVVSAIFSSVTYAIFFHLNIDENNKWSTFFSFTSAFSIFSTIGVYFWQKNDALNKQKDIDDRIIEKIEFKLKIINLTIISLITFLKNASNYDIEIDRNVVIFKKISPLIKIGDMEEEPINKVDIIYDDLDNEINQYTMLVSKKLYNIIKDINVCERKIFSTIYLYADHNSYIKNNIDNSISIESEVEIDAKEAIKYLISHREEISKIKKLIYNTMQ